MKTYISKWVLAGGLAAIVLAACGGGGDGGGGNGNGNANLFGSCNQNITIAAVDVVNYTQQVIAFDENSALIDMNCRTLATDETLLPQPIM